MSSPKTSSKPPAETLKLGSTDYPAPLREIIDPPALLYLRGRIPSTVGIAIVGSRECTPYGHRVAYRLAVDLVRCGFTVVSGLARGIDAAAHCGALDGGGTTVAVMPTGIDRVYPPGHRGLARRIQCGGAVITEFEPGTPVYPSNFHQRNRIIAGLSAATVVVEAAHKSGAKITARFALDYDREVLAVPGPIDSRVSQGAHDLIAEGAAPCTGVASVWEQLPATVREHATAPGDSRVGKVAVPADLPDESRRVVEAMTDGRSHGVDDLLEATGMPIAALLAALTDVEVRGLIRSLGGRRYEAV